MDDNVLESKSAASPGVKTPRKSYTTGPLPTELVDEVQGLTCAFKDALAKVTKKHNCLLHQVERLANLSSMVKMKRATNPFNGYAWKRKKEGLPTCK